MPRIWLEDPLGNTYRKNGNVTYIFNGKATNKDRKELSDFLGGKNQARVPIGWARVTENPIPTPKPIVPTGPIRIKSPIQPKVETRSRMRLAQRNSTH